MFIGEEWFSRNIQSIIFSPDNNTLAKQSGPNWRLVQKDLDHTHALLKEPLRAKSVAFSPDGEYIATITMDNKCSFYKTHGIACPPLICPLEHVNHVIFNPHKPYIAVLTTTGKGYFYEFPSIKPKSGSFEVDSPDEGVSPGLIFSPTGRLYLIYNEPRKPIEHIFNRHRWHLYDLEEGHIAPGFLNYCGSPYGLLPLFTPNEQRIITIENDATSEYQDCHITKLIPTIIMFRETPFTYHDQTIPIKEVKITPEGLIALSQKDNFWQLWNPDTAEKVGDPFENTSDLIYPVTPSCPFMATVSSDQKTLQLRGAHTRKPIDLPFYPIKRKGCTFSQDGLQLAIPSDSDVVLEQAEKNKSFRDCSITSKIGRDVYTVLNLSDLVATVGTSEKVVVLPPPAKQPAKMAGKLSGLGIFEVLADRNGMPFRQIPPPKKEPVATNTSTSEQITALIAVMKRHQELFGIDPFRS